MRNTITRKMIETKIEGYSIKISDGKKPEIVELNPVTVFGKVSQKEAVKALKNAHPGVDNITVGTITEKEVQFEITVDDFIKNAKRIEEKEGNN